MGKEGLSSRVIYVVIPDLVGKRVGVFRDAREAVTFGVDYYGEAFTLRTSDDDGRKPASRESAPWPEYPLYRRGKQIAEVPDEGDPMAKTKHRRHTLDCLYEDGGKLYCRHELRSGDTVTIGRRGVRVDARGRIKDPQYLRGVHVTRIPELAGDLCRVSRMANECEVQDRPVRGGRAPSRAAMVKILLGENPILAEAVSAMSKARVDEAWRKWITRGARGRKPEPEDFGLPPPGGEFDFVLPYADIPLMRPRRVWDRVLRREVLRKPQVTSWAEAIYLFMPESLRWTDLAPRLPTLRSEIERLSGERIPEITIPAVKVEKLGEREEIELACREFDEEEERRAAVTKAKTPRTPAPPMAGGPSEPPPPHDDDLPF
jgi:hypothetical protein